MSLAQTINTSALVYGDIIEHTIYKKPKYVFTQDEKKSNISDIITEKNRSLFSLSRTRNQLYRLLYCNQTFYKTRPPVFLTLTYAENVQSLTQTNPDYKRFIQRLRYHVDYPFKYVTIPEFQKRGAVHYHSMFFNLPFIDKTHIQDIWGHGWTRIESSRKIENLSAYMAKYLSKDIINNRTVGHRLLMTSRGLKRPVQFINSDSEHFLNKSVILSTISKFETELKIIYTYKYANSDPNQGY